VVVLEYDSFTLQKKTFRMTPFRII